MKALCVAAVLITVSAAAVVLPDQEQLALTRQFISQGSYYRAVSEARRHRFFYPRSPASGDRDFLEAYAYFLGKDYLSSLERCRAVKTEKGTALWARVFFLKGMNYILTGNYYAAAKQFDAIESKYKKFQYALLAYCAVYFSGQNDLRREKWRYIAKRYTTEANSPDARKFRELIETPLKNRSVQFSMLMSLMIPGFGHFYNDRPDAGFSAFASNLLFAGLTALAIVTGAVPYALLCGFVFMGFYSSNIYMAGRRTIDHNHHLREEREREVKALCRQLTEKMVSSSL